mgnify:CR=1 FL=1
MKKFFVLSLSFLLVLCGCALLKPPKKPIIVNELSCSYAQEESAKNEEKNLLKEEQHLKHRKNFLNDKESEEIEKLDPTDEKHIYSLKEDEGKDKKVLSDPLTKSTENENNVSSIKIYRSLSTINYDQESDDDVFISVIGNGKTEVSPDCAYIYANIETFDSDQTSSREKNLEIFQKIANILKDKNIDKDDIVLQYFSSYNRPSNGGNCYHTTSNFNVKICDLTSLKSICDLLLENGVTNINNINYEISTLEEIYSQTLVKAIENAKEKAQKMLNKTDLNVLKIKEECIYSCDNLYRNYSDFADGENYIGKIQIEARVLVDLI